MKKYLFTVLLAAVIIVAPADAQEIMTFAPEEIETASADNGGPEGLAKELSGLKGITSVFISKSMLALAGNMRGKVPVSKESLKKLDGIYIFSAEEETYAAHIKSISQKVLEKKDYELLMNADENGEHMSIHQRKVKEGLNEFVLFNHNDEGETNVIIILGDITAKDLEGLKM
mgnify:FL=1